MIILIFSRERTVNLILKRYTKFNNICILIFVVVGEQLIYIYLYISVYIHILIRPVNFDRYNVFS